MANTISCKTSNLLYTIGMKNSPSITSILADLKKRSDVLCPVMAEIHPLTNEQFLELALVTLVDLGYVITKE